MFEILDSDWLCDEVTSITTDDCQQLKPKRTEASFGTTVITATILFIVSILFSRVTVNVLVLHVRCCAPGFCVISKFCVRVF